MFRRRVMRVLLTTLAWVVLGVAIAIYDHLTYLMFEASYPGYSLPLALQTNTLGAIMGGGLGATLTVFVLKPRGRAHSFLYAVALHTATYTAIILGMTVVLTVLFQAQALSAAPFSQEVVEASMAYLSGAGPGKFALIWIVIATLTSVAHEVSDYYGPELFRAFLFGRYHTPRVEERAFMFLDLKSSTAIAERLGHVRYFELLQALFSAVTDPLIEHGGRVYQYVGDEVVVTWVGDSGSVGDESVRCFFAIQDEIRARSEHFEQRFGVSPHFRAGIHAGSVTSGAVGVLRKDIVHTGDVLNTAARIQGQAKEHDADLLVSRVIADGLRDAWKLISLGELELRGREERVEVLAVERGSTALPG